MVGIETPEWLYGDVERAFGERAHLVGSGEECCHVLGGCDQSAVANAILADILGLDYLIDPRVAGSITVQTTTPVSRDVARQLFQRALDLNGATLLQSDEIWTIAPKAPHRPSLESLPAQAVETSPPPSLLDRIPLSYASASDVRNAIRSLLGPEDDVQVDEARNALLLSTATEKLALVRDIVGVDVAPDIRTGALFSYAA